ncbi:MAG: SulP family inorganic anion transporter, partial [Candidatus Competibacteraceae bacterium]|nr:SulP family inorganic anion transporter [Candidatus Competibacteraceae bacterium]
MKPPNFPYSDLRGGLIAAAVVLPQATAFGVTVFAPYLGAASGALAGLAGAIGLLLISGGAGGTIGLISGPTGASMALLSGTAVLLATSNVPPEIIAPALFTITVLAGLFQLAIAFAGGGRLMKFIPYPVFAGLATGIGLLLIKSQIKPWLGISYSGLWTRWYWLPMVTTAIAFCAVRYAPRFIPNIPGPLIGLVGGTLFYQLILYLTHPPSVPSYWVIGALPLWSDFDLALNQFTIWSALPWSLILHAAFTLAVLCSLNTLLTAVIADTTTGQRHNAHRELLAQGFGQVAVGLFGGLAGAASVGGTTTAVQAGARRWAALTAGILLLVLLLFAGSIGQWLPTSALAGIIIASALNLMEKDIIAWARQRRTRLDAAVALLVTLVTFVQDLMIAVLVGLSIAILLFIRSQSRLPVIQRRLTALERPSVRKRPADQVEWLAHHGDRIVMYHLSGILFFAKTDQLFEEMLPDLDRRSWVI